MSISHRGHKGGRRQHADPKDPRQSFGSLLVVYPFGEFIVIPFDPLVDASMPKPRSKTVALVRQYLRQIPLELASLLRHDATLQHERTQLIDERCPLCNQASAHAMQ